MEVEEFGITGIGYNAHTNEVQTWNQNYKRGSKANKHVEAFMNKICI